MERGIRAMKYWCYYANVVRYLEKVEALFVPKTRGPAYLVWTDDEGPHMIAGPGIHWYRGDGPMPDLDALEIPVSIRAPIRAPNAREGSAHTQSTPKKQLRAARVSKRLPPNPQSTSTKQTKPKQVRSHQPPRQCRATTWRTAHHTRNDPEKGEQKAYNFSETRSNLLTHHSADRAARDRGASAVSSLSQSECCAPAVCTFPTARSVSEQLLENPWLALPRNTLESRPSP